MNKLTEEVRTDFYSSREGKIFMTNKTLDIICSIIVLAFGAAKLFYSLFTKMNEENKKIIFNQDFFGSVGKNHLLFIPA